MSIIKKPIITEKMTNDTELFNRYSFVVDRKANKIQIKKAVEEQYDVVVDSVRTMVCIGKKRVRGTKSGMIVGKTSTYKKAIVQLYPPMDRKKTIVQLLTIAKYHSTQIPSTKPSFKSHFILMFMCSEIGIVGQIMVRLVRGLLPRDVL